VCDYDVEVADHWNEWVTMATEHKSCDECGHPIRIGTIHHHGEGWNTPEWEDDFDGDSPDWTCDIHEDCLALKRYINNEHCGREPYAIGDLRDNVKEHYRDEPELLRKWAAILRTRRKEANGSSKIKA
jgi:hypothetical protein